jgi:putative glutamine amidotransferase
MHNGLVAIPADIRSFDGYTWHAAPDQYIRAAVNGAGVLPLVVPALEDGADVDMVLDRVDGVLISGSRTNVHPSHYGEDETESHGPFDPARDRVSMALIRRAIERGIPLLAICRGIQELNVALGGSLGDRDPGVARTDGSPQARNPRQGWAFAIRHSIKIKEGSCLASILGSGEVQVNSLHRQAISRIAPRLATRLSRRTEPSRPSA